MIKEILCIHHSHFDIGYTHPQPMLLELQRTYIDKAIKLCKKTENNVEGSKFRWTCEATYPLIKWLETASKDEIAELQRLCKKGLFDVSGLLFHTTPLMNYRQVVSVLKDKKYIEDVLGIEIKTAISHDVNGQPWELSQLLADVGIDFYLTGINIHFGKVPFQRPYIFNWEAQDGKSVKSFLGEHYSLFSQFLNTSMLSVVEMKKGVDEYVNRLEANGYPYEFALLTATNPPLFDNNCPDLALCNLIDKYNEQDYTQKIRMVTPSMLREICQQFPAESLDTHRGDWTDCWNFGSGSSAMETGLSRKTKTNFNKLELLETVTKPCKNYDLLKKQALLALDIFDEHTWGAADSILSPDALETYCQKNHKAEYMYMAADITAFLLGQQMELWTNNRSQSQGVEGVVILNAGNNLVKKDIYLPENYFENDRALADLRMKQFLPYNCVPKKYVGAVELEPYSYVKIPLAELPERLAQNMSEDIIVKDGAIETQFYEFIYDTKRGTIISLYSKKLRRYIYQDEEQQEKFFGFVHETIDETKADVTRKTFFPRDLDLGNRSISVWNHNWPPIRTCGCVKGFEVKVEGRRIDFIQRVEGLSVKDLEQTISFYADSEEIGCKASFYKCKNDEPEAIYFAFPLPLEKDWRCKYDLAGALIELDEEQIGNVCRDHLTIENTISLYDEKLSVTLASDETPLVQVGNFSFGKENLQVARNEKPLLLSWAINNYWDTNFWASQEGYKEFSYQITIADQFDEAKVCAAGEKIRDMVIENALTDCTAYEEGKIIEITGEGVRVQYIKQSENQEGYIVCLKNLQNEKKEILIKMPFGIEKSTLVSPLEEDLESIEIVEDKAMVRMAKFETKYIRIRGA